MSNSTSLPPKPLLTPNVDASAEKLSQSMSGTSIGKNIFPANRRQSCPNIKPNLNIKKNNLNDHKVNRSTGSTNPNGDAKLQSTEQKTDNSEPDINKTDNSEKATNAAQAKPKQNDTPVPNDAATVTKASVSPDTPAAKKSPAENTANPEINSDSITNENSTNNVNGNDNSNISAEEIIAQILADIDKICQPEANKGYEVKAGGISTVFRDKKNVEKFKRIMKGFQSKGPEQYKQINSYINFASDVESDQTLGVVISPTLHIFLSGTAMGAEQAASWGFVSGNNEMREKKIQDIKSKIEEIRSKVKEIASQGTSGDQKNELKNLQDELNKLKTQLETEVPSFWDCQTTDEAKLIAAEFIKKQQKIIQDKLIGPIEKKKNLYIKAKNFFQQLVNLLRYFISNLTPSNRNFLIKIADNIKTRSENTIEWLDEQFAEQSTKQLTQLPSSDFVKAIVNLANNPKYQIACIEGTIGDMSLGWKRGFTNLTNCLNPAIRALLWDTESNKITVETLNDFARKYGQETLDLAIRTLYTAKLSSTDAGELKETYEAYWERSGRKGKCPVDEGFDNKIRELNWPDSKLKPPKPKANPAKSDN